MSRKIFILIGFLIILIVAFLIFKNSKNNRTNMLEGATIVAFGDSLVRGVGASNNNDFVTVLSGMINEPIVNMGISGNTTAQGLARIDEVIEKDPKIVLLLLGGNDYLRKVPIETTFNNLESIVSKLEESGATVIILGIKGGILNDPYKDRFEKLAKKHDALYVPDVLDGLFGNTKYMSDPIHPNDLGYKQIAEKVHKVMKDIENKK